MTQDLISRAAEPPQDDKDTEKRRRTGPRERPTEASEPETSQTAQKRAPRIPELPELIEQLRKLSGMVLLGLITPAQANVLQRSINKTIDVVLRQQTAPPTVAHQAGLIDACRTNPELIALLEPFLTQDQLTELMRQANDDEA